MRLAAFLVDGTSAFKLHRGTWHTSAFPLAERASFLVLDREGTLEEDYDLRDLKAADGVAVEIVSSGFVSVSHEGQVREGLG
jgi:ureidoglycolate hydrolase